MALYVNDGVKFYEPDMDGLVMTALSANGVLSGGSMAAQGVPNMTIQVAAGVLGAQGTVVPIVANAALAITAADPGLPRIDTVHADQITGVVAIAVGTPNAVPKPAALPAGKVLLGYVSVAAAAVNIQQSNITNRRLPVGAMQPMLAGTLASRPSASAITGQTYFATDTAQLARSNGTTWTIIASGAGGVVLAADGTVAAPGFAFNSEPGSGLYRIGAGDVGLSILGVKVAEFTASAVKASQPVWNPDGTVGAPGATFTTQQNMGMYRIGADILGVAVAGAEQARFTTTGLKTASVITPTADGISEIGTAALRFADANFASFVAIGTPPAASGIIRIPNATTLTARNAGNTADLGLISVSAANILGLYDSRQAANVQTRTVVADGLGHVGASQVVWTNS